MHGETGSDQAVCMGEQRFTQALNYGDTSPILQFQYALHIFPQRTNEQNKPEKRQ